MVSQSRRIVCGALFLALCFSQFAGVASAQSQAASPALDVRGTLVDEQSNLGVPDATVELLLAGTVVQEQRSNDQGAFAFSGVVPDVYSLRASAHGFVTVQRNDIVVRASSDGSAVRLITSHSSGAASDAREIGRVTTARDAITALQTTATINRRVSPETGINENLMRVGQNLASLPGVNLRNQDQSVGDDLYVDIRGLKPSETQTLLDGHPIGPIGVLPGTAGQYNYQDSPPFAFQNVLVTFGGGALGLYGTNSIGGSVDLQTWNPTAKPSFFFQQGVGDQGHSWTNMRATGTSGKLGYAAVFGVSGTVGPFAPQMIEQNGNLGTNLTSANAAANTYLVSSNYVQRDLLLKARYNLSVATTLSVTGYSATSWADKTGNGDNNATTIPYQLYIAPTNKPSAAVCPGQVTVKEDSGTQCLSALQWATATAGPQGSFPVYQAIGNQDYNAQLVTVNGKHTFTADVFLDAYNRLFNSGDHQFVYHTSGVLLSDDIDLGRNQFGFGYYNQHQLVTGTTTVGSLTDVPRQPAALGDGNVFLRDSLSLSKKLSFVGNVWLKSSTSTGGNSLDPRFSFIYRLTPSDVLRLSGSKAEGDPDPSLSGGMLVTNPIGLDPPCGAFRSGGGSKLNIGTVGNPSLSPETGTDAELSYGHRFGGDSAINVSLYNTNVANQLFSANVAAAPFQSLIPPSLLTGIFNRIQSTCSVTPSINQLVLARATNTSSGRFQGVEVSGRVRLSRAVYVDYSYDLQSAVQMGVPDSLLRSNPTIINGSQILGIPLHKQSLSIDYSTPGKLELHVDGYHLDANNGLNRPAYAYANGFVSAGDAHLTATFGVFNIFNSAVADYGLIGLGTFNPENQFGTDGNAFDQAAKMRGLTERSFNFSLSTRI
jgi:Carboxypeptidase regulatory-like domain/TonB-dependent Receptor Plug Domain